MSSMKDGNGTTDRVVDVLLAFLDGRTWLGVSAIARQTGLSKSVVHRILQTFVRRGVLAYSETSRKYALGNAVLALGALANHESRFIECGRPLIQELAREVGETATLAVRVGFSRSFVAEAHSNSELRLSVKLGECLPITLGATGYAILAHLPESEIKDVLKHGSLASADDGLAFLEEVRRKGWAFSESERVAETIAVAAPVFGLRNAVLGAVSIAGFAGRFTSERVEEVGGIVVESANQLSRQLLKGIE